MLEFLEEIGRGLIDLFESFSDDPDKLRGHQAEFADADNIISSTGGGFAVTGDRHLSNKQSYEGMMAVGSTGTGKSAVVCIPAILGAKNASLVINDPSGELYQKTSGALQQKGFEVKVINFSDALHSAGFNPAKRAHTRSKRQKLSSMQIDTALPNAKDPFWNTSASGVGTLGLNILATQEDEYRTMHNVYKLIVSLSAKPKAVDKLFADYASDDDFAEYKAFVSHDEKLQTSVLSTAKAAFQIYTDEHVAKVTSFDTVDFESFRTRPIALFIRTNIGDAKFLNGIVSILFQQFISGILERIPDKGERDIFFILDEAASLKIPVLPIAMANLRKHRCGVLLLLQSEQQLVENYGRADAQSVMMNCNTKLYFTNQDLETAQKLEQLLGKKEVTDEDDEKRKSIVSLLTADTIRSLPKDKGILLSSSHRPALVKLKPYYKIPRLRRLTEIPAPEIECELPFFNIPVLSLSTPEPDEED